MPSSAEDLSLEHIDPRNHHLICGLKNDHNEVIAIGSYNYSKANLFLPYRVKDYPAPVNPGDLGEFYYRGGWMVTEFMGEWWKEAAYCVLQGRRGGVQRVNWEERITEQEQRHNNHILVCSFDGSLAKTRLAVRYCEHMAPRPQELWFYCKPQNHCCITQSNRITNERNAKRALEARHQCQPC